MEQENAVVVLEFKPEIFDPKKEVLMEIAAEVAKITADPEKMTKDDLELIKTTKNKLVKARTSIAKAGKAARDAATQYNRDVKAYENSLIAIIEPEEKRLKELSDAAEKHAIREARKETLPEYKEKLLSINGTMPKITDEELLDMDPTQFQQYYNDCREEHFNTLEQERIDREAKEAEAKEAEAKRIAEERAEIEREKEKLTQEKYNSRVQRILTLGFVEAGSNFVFGKPGQQADVAVDILNIKELSDSDFEALYTKVADNVVAVKKQWEADAEKQKQAEIAAAAEAAKKEAEQKAAAQEAQRLADEEAAKKAAQEQKEKEEAEQKERQAAEEFQKWLVDNSYNENTDKLIEENGVTTLYRKVASI